MGLNMREMMSIEHEITQEAIDFVAISGEGDLVIEFAKSGATKKWQRIRLNVFSTDYAVALFIAHVGDGKYLLSYEQEGAGDDGANVKRVHDIEMFSTEADANSAKRKIADVFLSHLGNTKKPQSSPTPEYLLVIVAAAFFVLIEAAIYWKFARYMIFSGIQIVLMALSFTSAAIGTAFMIYRKKLDVEAKCEFDKIIFAALVIATLSTLLVISPAFDIR